MPELPTGNVTLLFTDIEGSTELLHALKSDYSAVLMDHHRIIRAALEQWQGQEVDTQGDAFFAAFKSAANAVAATVAAQQALAAYAWPDGVTVHVRMGLHTGEPQRVGSQYVGLDLHLGARVMHCGYGGQVLLTQTTHELVRGSLPTGVTLRALGDFRLKDFSQPESIYQLVIPGLRSDFPTLKSMGINNLREPLSPFIGQEKQINTWVEKLCDPSTRLLTLTGFGGMGKTRSALEIAWHCLREHTQEFPDGVWWIDLAEIENADGMFQRIAYDLNFYLQPPPSAQEQLIKHLSERKVLLVLDNVEQIREAEEVINQLLGVAPGLKLLVTSRRSLNLRVQQREEVKPLPLKNAIQLFLTCAQAAESEFDLNADNTGAVQELCRYLDGVPLAIELVATQVVMMEPSEIVEGLKDIQQFFELLNTDVSDLPDRHRTLLATLHWSYKLLDPKQQMLLA
nr:adenylate/guanylate cyclase domain-containing protein [Armatimonadota bacterium]